ncbi:unnamed protein product [Peronospora belbahrii]|uniref:t-SNARE coiled-coil homology domain-containing protein n=1 Tax=Peronospora belbahrii TaxID=622444 RepID=A0ABN8CKA1_9STRA|nr:unnamed protein product [Peronospora belbahrii]
MNKIDITSYLDTPLAFATLQCIFIPGTLRERIAAFTNKGGNSSSTLPSDKTRMMMEDGELRDAELTGEFNEMSTPKLEDRMDKALQDQDQQLDAIYTGVTRLHLVADATNEEVLSQNAMLDQVVVQVNDTEAAVQQQTKAARKVARAHRELGCYYVIIMLLLIALLIIIFI